MPQKDTAYQEPDTPPHVLSGGGLSALENEAYSDSNPDRRSHRANESRHSNSQYYHVRVGELDCIQRAISDTSEPIQDDQDNSALLLSRLYEAQEEAARCVAQRLHDDSAQMLAVVYLELANIKRDCDKDIANRIGGVEKLLDGVREQIRGLSHELRPPVLDHLGLVPALRFLASGFSQRSSIEICVVGSAEGLSHTVEIALYRVVQEALSNIVSHAHATSAEVRLWVSSDNVCCTITDNGAGFTLPDDSIKSTHGLGLLGIYERVAALGGECDIVSCRRKGTRFTELQVEIPV